MIHNIPQELKLLPQWVCCRADKIPLNPRNGYRADVTDPFTWSTFADAVATGLAVGFVLTPTDPYTIIDLDNKPGNPLSREEEAAHTRILTTLASYTEHSYNGKGYHIIVRGKIAEGLHRGNVEVYSHSRFMVCTGNVVNWVPIQDRQDLLLALQGEMKASHRIDLLEEEGTQSDQAIVDMAQGASNGHKYLALCRGEWQSLAYPSQSEADYALLSMLCFYTRDNEQVRRLFRYSNLGKREKALRNSQYLDRCLQKIRANQAPLIDMTAIRKEAERLEAERAQTIISQAPTAEEAGEAFVDNEAQAPSPEGPSPLPPGLVGELADYIYRSSIRPVPEVALAASLALVAGIVGRCYNVSGAGLNQYLILIGKTGTGKEGAVSGIDRIITAVRPQVPAIDSFIGPSAFASGQAIIRAVDEKQSFVSVLGEFGITLQQLCDPRASGPQLMLKKVLLDLYSKSGKSSTLRTTAYSDTEKNTKVVRSPAVTLLGESTPEAFFDGLDSSHISEGLIPRFTVVEYLGKRPPKNTNNGFAPDEALVKRVSDVASTSLTMQHNKSFCNVRIDPQALAVLDAFDKKSDKNINESASDVDNQLWNRAHLKALKLSALLAVGVDHHTPLVTLDLAEWAVALVLRDVQTMTKRFTEGNVGDGEHKQEIDIRHAIESYLTMTTWQQSQYKVPKKIQGQPLIPFCFLRRWCRLKKSFKNDRKGASAAIDNCLKDLVKAQILKQVPADQTRLELGTDSPVFLKGESW
jgi:hypothetical protein